jgi:hypothetical protein
VTDQLVPQSRRSVLAAALGGLGGAVLAALARPLPIKAADPNDVVLNAGNDATAVTTITQTTADTGAFGATGNGTGTGVAGASTTGIGVSGTTTSGTGISGESTSGAGVFGRAATTDRAGVVGVAGDTSDSSLDADVDLDSGVYGYADQTFNSSGVWGESFDGIGVVGSGALGALALGFDGTLSQAFGGTAVHAHTGGGPVPTPPTNAALFGSVTSNANIGLEARGRVRFPSRSGRATIAAGKSTVAVSVAGMTSGNIVFAVLNSSGGGRFVRTVIPATGKITIYLNAAVSSNTSVAWLVLG